MTFACSVLTPFWGLYLTKEVAPRFAIFPCQSWLFAGDFTRPALVPAPSR